jgi:hypothetical protein
MGGPDALLINDTLEFVVVRFLPSAFIRIITEWPSNPQIQSISCEKSNLFKHKKSFSH